MAQANTGRKALIFGGVLVGGYLLYQLMKSSQAQKAANTAAAANTQAAGPGSTLSASLTDLASGLTSIFGGS